MRLSERIRADVEAAPWVIDEVKKLEAEVASLNALSVTNILIDVVPGEDGMGQEVYAKSVSEIEALLTKLSEENENLKAYAKHERSLGAEPWMLQCNDLTQQLAAANGRVDELCKVARALDMAANHSVLEELPEVMREASKRIFAAVNGNGKTGAQMLDAAISGIPQQVKSEDTTDEN